MQCLHIKYTQQIIHIDRMSQHTDTGTLQHCLYIFTIGISIHTVHDISKTKYIPGEICSQRCSTPPPTSQQVQLVY